MVEVGAVNEGFGLGGEDARDAGVAVAEAVDGDASGEVEIAAVFEVPETAAFAFGEDRWGPDVRGDHVGGLGGSHYSGLGVFWRVGGA